MNNRWRGFIMGIVVLFVLIGCSEEEPLPTPTAVSEQTTASPTAAEPAAATAVAEKPTAVAVAEEPIYLSLIWHQHQPVYYKDPETNTYVRPWVRVHATKDYVDMAAILEQYPDIRATFNLTPSLIRQLDDLAAGAKDLYWTTAEIRAEDLTDEQKQFLIDRFFDTNRNIIARFPRYQELLNLRDNSPDPLQAFTTQDYLDLQILFNLAWVDPDWLAEEPLAGLVAKGENFSEADKEILFQEHLRLIKEVIPVHRSLQDRGQIEVTMTPFAHPILPLLVDTNLAKEALPDVILPLDRYTYGQDAVAQVERGVALYEEHFGQPPRGMWPAEGSVAQEIISMVALNDIEWMASDEGVLANSLGFDSFTRDANEVVVEADQLYRPYYVEGRRGGPVAMVFRDVALSDKVGFTYSGMDGTLAAQDFINRIHDIRQELVASGAEGPHLVSVILDGENAWEYYENDGKEFLHTLYQGLSDDPLIETVTPSQFLQIAPEQPTIDDLFAGSWINHDYATWIGEEEENAAWQYLAETRAFLEQYISGNRQGRASEEALQEALTQMYVAEGSDWFWWYGADQNSNNDSSFDLQYRETLKQVYTTLGEEPPPILDVPIIPEQAVEASRPSTDLITPQIDGAFTEGEWDAGGQYQAAGGVMAGAQGVLNSLTYGFDGQNFYLQVAFAPDFELPAGESSLEVYLSVPGSRDGSANFSRYGQNLLGFPANKLLAMAFTDGELVQAELLTAVGEENWEAESTVQTEIPGRLTLVTEPDLISEIAQGADGLEASLPLAALGNIDTADQLRLRSFFQQTVTLDDNPLYVDTDQIPGTGSAVITVPDLGNTIIVFDVMDPEGDDHGPGTYKYPSDAVFSGGSYDITSFQVGSDEENIIFRFEVRGPIENVWDSPNGLSIQTFDIYIDSDQVENGGKALLPGRNVSLQEGFEWDYAVTVEGWTSGIYVPGAEGPQQIAESSEFLVLTDPTQRKVTIRIPKTILGDNPEAWQYAAAVLSQEGFPSGGVMRVRDVLPVAEQWRVGGAPEGTTNHTRVMDLVWPIADEQEAWLSDFPPADALQIDLTAVDYARIPLLSQAE